MSFDFKGNGKGGKKAAKGNFGNSGGGFGVGSNAGGVPDPLADVEYTDKLDVDSASELSALQEGFASRGRKERERFRAATDSEFWFAVCFKTREEKEAFLKAAKVHKSLMGDKYIDGVKLAKILGIDM